MTGAEGHALVLNAPKTGVLLLNLGTPQAATTKAVRKYLGEFLMDGRVINMPAVLRWLLVHGIILRTRPRHSAAAYRAVWTQRGSPLLVAAQDLSKTVQTLFDDDNISVTVSYAMRYGQPSIESALREMVLAGVERLVVMPLYPQYAAATTGSSVAKVMEVASKMWTLPALTIVPPFYDAPAYIGAVTEVTKARLDAFAPDHVLFSFHGVPEDHITLGEQGKGHCLASASCCDRPCDKNRLCYRAHSFATYRALVKTLGLDPAQTTLAFQSRLGKKKWLEPATDVVVRQLGGKVKRLAVLSPAFVADCLETLEELGIRARQDFSQAGGEEMLLVPCLNAHPAWATGVKTLVQQSASWLASPAPKAGRDSD